MGTNEWNKPTLDELTDMFRAGDDDYRRLTINGPIESITINPKEQTFVIDLDTHEFVSMEQKEDKLIIKVRRKDGR